MPQPLIGTKFDAGFVNALLLAMVSASKMKGASEKSFRNLHWLFLSGLIFKDLEILAV